VIDAHHHLWDTATREYGWMDGPWADPIRGRFDLARYAAATDAEAGVVVQAVMDEAETAELLTAPVAGVVGWTDLTAPDVADRLAALKEAGPLVGIRHQVQDEPDPEWLTRPAVVRGIAAVGAAGLVYDLLVKPPQAAAALDVVRRLPEVSFVLDHAGKPDIAGGDWEPWASWITDLAALPNVTVKLSGLVTEAAPDWRPADILPYARHVLSVFGPSRTMYGSDWPVCTLAATPDQVRALAEEALSPGDRNEVFGETARRVYRLS
jgi:L-fuconolactonase